MATRQLYPTDLAALYLGTSAETLRSWRRRGVGPAYVRFPGGHVRRGDCYWEQKANGTICYSLDALEAFWKAREVQAGRLPRPFPGRLPGGKNAAKPTVKARPDASAPDATG